MFQGIATRIAKKAAADVAAPFIRKEMRALGRESTLRATLMLSAATLIVAGASYTPTTHSEDDGEHREEMENWSGTHRVRPVAILRPESAEEVAAIVASSQNRGLKLRVVGNALSPNGIGFSDGIMLSMALCDQVLEVDPLRGTVRVEAGARVQQVVEALQAYELTLQNYASISEQQIGGFLQVGAHGTGARIPPVDEQVISMKLATPGLGVIEISRKSHPEMFKMARVGLGAFGVVTEVTIQCIPRHQLMETTVVLSRVEAVQQHQSLLHAYQHLRYMWIPYTDAVVVVASNPISIGAGHSRWDEAPLLSVPDVTFTEGQRLAPLLALLREQGEGQESCDELNFAELRDMLLARSPLDCAWIKKVNGAEAEFWRRSQGQRIDYSDRILGFECGGQQWVNEVALHAGTACHPTGADMNFLQDLLRHIEGASIPAPAPIEQRWTASSSSSMSPAYGACGDELYSWVGIIMYLPLEDSQQRDAVTSAFFSYRDECKKALWARYGCAEHWAKVEMPQRGAEAVELQQRIRKRYPVEDFNALRHMLDPANIMANEHVDALFGTGRWGNETRETPFSE